LIAAIPAGIAYNRYISQVDRLSTKYRTFVDEFIAILQRRMVSADE
jgi:biopolymer transport protein TolQ